MKRLSLINKILACIFVIATIVMAIVLKEIEVLLYLPVIIIPFIIKLKPLLTFLYLIFTCISIFLGSLCHLFKLTIWFDSFSHFTWGILSSLAAIYILDKLKMYDKKNVLFNIVFIFVFSLATSGFWEICEFTVDNVLGSDTQRAATGVFDTMKDIIVALLGNILFLVWYYYETKHSFKGCIHYLIDNMDTK